jgi:glyoxalase family protein
VGPGFPLDESVAELGTTLKLPPMLEARRSAIAAALRPLRVPAWKLPQENT